MVRASSWQSPSKIRTTSICSSPSVGSCLFQAPERFLRGVLLIVVIRAKMTLLTNFRLTKNALLLPLLLMFCGSAGAQTFQFLPEVDLYSKIQPSIRFNFQVKETREASDPTQVEIGPGFDFFLRPLVRLQKITVFDQI